MTFHLGTAQLVLLAISLLGLLLTAKDHGKPRKPENFWVTLISHCISYAILAWGGWFR